MWVTSITKSSILYIVTAAVSIILLTITENAIMSESKAAEYFATSQDWNSYIECIKAFINFAHYASFCCLMP